MKQNRVITSQPYPLWAVVSEPDALWIGLVIAWAHYDDGDQIESFPIVNQLNCNSCTASQLEWWFSLHLSFDEAQQVVMEMAQ